MRGSFYSFLVLSICGPIYALEPENLVSVINAVLAQNSELKAAQAQLEGAQAGLSEARLQRLPNLSARSQWTRGDNPVYAFGSLLEQGRFGPANFAIDSLNHPADLSNIKSGLDLGIPLFTGFELTTAVHTGELGVQQAQSKREGTLQQLRRQASRLYLQWILDQALLRNLDERIAASTQEVDDAQRLKDRGVVLGSDYYAAEAILSGLKSWRVQVQTDQASSGARLSLMTGREDLRPDGVLSNPAYTVPAQKDMTQQALTRRPDLLSAGSLESIAQVGRKQARRSILPKVQAFASLETDTNDFSSNPTNHLYGVSARLPFGDPGYFSRRSRADAAEEAARQSRANLEEDIREEVAQAYAAYEGAIAYGDVVKDTVARAAKSLELFRPLYRSGRQSIIEVLRAEEGLAKAQASYDEALFRIHSGYLQLMAASGMLDDRAIQTVSTQLGKHL